MANIKPVRLQLSRRKGFDLQALSLATNGLEAAKVSRPSIFGNPFHVFDMVLLLPPGETPRTTAVKSYREWLAGETWAGEGDLIRTPPTTRLIVDHLHGKNLACWCCLDQCCHADVLLELANG